ncbi:hypothetical protein ACLOJK_040063 [Asimina triloba]
MHLPFTNPNDIQSIAIRRCLIKPRNKPSVRARLVAEEFLLSTYKCNCALGRRYHMTAKKEGNEFGGGAGGEQPSRELRRTSLGAEEQAARAAKR